MSGADQVVWWLCCPTCSGDARLQGDRYRCTDCGAETDRGGWLLSDNPDVPPAL